MRILLATMTFLGLAYVFITPPMRVPDEHLHFFRSAAIANGHLIPHGHGKADSAQIPQGLKTLVWVISTRQSFQTAIRIPLEPVKQPVTLAAIKADPKFKEFKLVRQSRLSVVPVSDEHWKLIMKMSGGK